MTTMPNSGRRASGSGIRTAVAPLFRTNDEINAYITRYSDHLEQDIIAVSTFFELYSTNDTRRWPTQASQTIDILLRFKKWSRTNFVIPDAMPTNLHNGLTILHTFRVQGEPASGLTPQALPRLSARAFARVNEIAIEYCEYHVVRLNYLLAVQAILLNDVAHWYKPSAGQASQQPSAGQPSRKPSGDMKLMSVAVDATESILDHRRKLQASRGLLVTCRGKLMEQSRLFDVLRSRQRQN